MKSILSLLLIGCVLIGCSRDEVLVPQASVEGVGSGVVLDSEPSTAQSPIEEFGGIFARENQILSLANLGLTEMPDVCGLLTEEQKSQVKSLDLQGNDVEIVDVDLSCLPLLTEIDLSFNKVTSVERVGTPLKKIFLNNNNISSLKDITIDTSQMESLVIPHNQLTTLQGIGAYPQLVNLEVYRNNLVSLEGVEQLEDLEKIKLEFNQLTSLSLLDSLPNLGFVTAKYNNIDPDTLVAWEEKTKSYITTKQAN